MKFQGSTLTLLSIALLMAFNSSSAKTIRATAEGDPYPDLREAPGSIANGDFFITDKRVGRVIGDGDNEITNWSLDFRNNFDSDIEAMRKFFQKEKSLCSAILSLTMHPGRTNGMRGDVIGIIGLRPLGQNLPFLQNWSDTSVTQDIQFDFLEHYSAEDINNTLKGYPLGAIHLRYYDDALISKASLELNYSDTDDCSEDLQQAKVRYEDNFLGIAGGFIPNDNFGGLDKMFVGIDTEFGGLDYAWKKSKQGDISAGVEKFFIPGDNFAGVEKFFIPGDNFTGISGGFVPGDQF